MIYYNIPPFNQAEAAHRLSDAALFAALKSKFGDLIEPWNNLQSYTGTHVLWGADPHHEDMEQLQAQQSFFRRPIVLDHLNARIVRAGDLAAEVARLCEYGHGFAVRNMKDPCHRKRFLPEGYAGKSDAEIDFGIGTLDKGDEVLIQEYHNLNYVRRYLVVGGAIAEETPLIFFEERPSMVLDRSLRLCNSRDCWGTPEPAEPDELELQRRAALDLLAHHPITSGYIDVGQYINDGGESLAFIDDVSVCRPGGFFIACADPVTYVDALFDYMCDAYPGFREKVQGNSSGPEL